VAWATAAPANLDLLMPSVARMFEALPVTDDGPLAAKRAELATPSLAYQFPSARDPGTSASGHFTGDADAQPCAYAAVAQLRRAITSGWPTTRE
jgi:hypothetical protein